jgi:hypothetical protein
VFSVVALFSSSAIASVCDHAPSKLVGTGITKLGASGAGLVAGAGIALKAAGLYAIPNAVTGVTMLGSTAAGASAAGTVGIIEGTAGVIGTVGAGVMSPFILVPAALFAGGVGVYEGGCYFASKGKPVLFSLPQKIRSRNSKRALRDEMK